MSDKYGYVGLETLLNFCSNQKDHCVTPNDFMRMNRVKIDERPHGEWIRHVDDLFPEESTEECSVCHEEQRITGNDDNFCPNCGADMREGDAE